MILSSWKTTFSRVLSVKGLPNISPISCFLNLWHRNRSESGRVDYCTMLLLNQTNIYLLFSSYHSFPYGRNRQGREVIHLLICIFFFRLSSPILQYKWPFSKQICCWTLRRILKFKCLQIWNFPKAYNYNEAKFCTEINDFTLLQNAIEFNHSRFICINPLPACYSFYFFFTAMPYIFFQNQYNVNN